MARALTRTHFHSARLVRELADLSLVNASQPGDAFAEKLAEWVGIKDAISLRAAHGAVAAGTAQTDAGAGLAEECARLRAAMEQAMTGSASEAPGPSGKPKSSGKAARGHLDLPAPKPGAPLELAGAYEPYRRHYAAHQREMELALRPLRAQVREALHKSSPALQQLAALDAALEGILNEREARLLASLPALLERRFKQLRASHQQHLLDTQASDSLADWTRPGGWLCRFGEELQSVLLAEWDLRLQPTLGLLEALHNDTTQQL